MAFVTPAADPTPASAPIVRPELTVVVPSVNGFGDLEGCLAALAREANGVRLEALVVDRCGGELPDRVRKNFSAVRLVEVPRSTSIPEMRALAFDHAAAPAVAVIEDHVIVPPGWAREMVNALGNGDAVVGGAVDNAATETTLDWAAFLCEYSHCLPPLPAGASDWLTGNNVVYPKALLDRFRTATHAGQWEGFLHDALRREGILLMCRPEIVVDHKKHYTFSEYFSQRYLYSRSYAGARVAGAGLPRRVAFGVAALALPPVLLYRIASRITAKPAYRRHLVRTLPLIALFTVAWAAGEAVGSWLGPSDSLQKIC